MFVILTFATTAFTYSDDTYYNGGRLCVNKLHCFATTMSFGLRNGGGIGEV